MHERVGEGDRLTLSAPFGDLRHRPGRVEPGLIPVGPDIEAYLCGRVPLMQSVRAALRERGVPAERIHYDVFGAAA
ncbi:hypothetical protein [Dactylosporangium sp. CA-139066]|uniref:hypothetical protein n=1 Tax=Dactylosporangium sp. CA-139066 TaxID=3239930 RepID=UPI003D8FC290